MTPQNAHRPLRQEAAGAFPANSRRMAKADREALRREEAEHAAEEERLRAAEYDDGDNGNHTEPADERDEEAGLDAEGEEAESSAEEAGTGSDRSPVDESAADELRRK